jgi:hypothetical protein
MESDSRVESGGITANGIRYPRFQRIKAKNPGKMKG